jgi:GNAT superfamily N-acetyltransferase
MAVAARRAEGSDAATACDPVRNSIIELCILDHCGDETTIAARLSNKTCENLASWISSPRHVAVVAEMDGTVAGFGLLDLNGTIALFYVAPQYRFRGVSKALLVSLEERAVALGITVLALESSATALSFYEGCGYLRTGDTVQGFVVTRAYPLFRTLAP